MKPRVFTKRFAVATFSLALLASSVRADVIYLSSGGIVKGTIVKEGRDSITVKTTGGSSVVIPTSEVDRIERGGSPDAMYREKLKKIALGDAEGHYQLGLWLKSINVKDLAKEEFLKTIMLEPDHRFAREELGYSRDTFNRWVLPNEKSDDAPSAPSPRAEAPARAEKLEPKAEPKPEPEVVAKAPEVKVDANGLSPELANALAAIAGKDGAARKAAFEKLDATVEEESARVMAILSGPFSKAREKVAQAVAKVSTGADTIAAKVPADGSKDEALTGELKTHVDAYLEKAVRPAVLTTVRSIERNAAGEVARLSGFLKTYIKDYRSDSAVKRREKAFTTWVSARDEALRVIFDKTIYPDENHGRVGQPTVDEKVDLVRAAWQFLDPQVQRDLSRYLGTSEADAKRTAQLIADAKARHAQSVAYLEAKGEKAEALNDIAPIDEALIRYRAGEIDAALALEGKLSAYEKELLKRMRDQRVLDYNDGFVNRKVEKGKLPSGQEMEQVKITNEYRIMQGRPALEIDTRLVESARGHSEEMTRLGYFDHTSPVGANKTPWDRIKNAGYEGAAGENISLGSEAPKATHIAWYNSSGHHRNILGPTWVGMGSGKDGKHWTQNFGGAAGLLNR